MKKKIKSLIWRFFAKYFPIYIDLPHHEKDHVVVNTVTDVKGRVWNLCFDDFWRHAQKNGKVVEKPFYYYVGSKNGVHKWSRWYPKTGRYFASHSCEIKGGILGLVRTEKEINIKEEIEQLFAKLYAICEELRKRDWWYAILAIQSLDNAKGEIDCIVCHEYYEGRTMKMD